MPLACLTDDSAHQNVTKRAVKSAILKCHQQIQSKNSQFYNVNSQKKTDGEKRERAKNEETQDALNMQEEGALEEKSKVWKERKHDL